MNLPYLKLYPGDWQKNPDFKRCSHHARGVLFDTLCLAAETEDRGVFISNGKPWSEKELSEAIGGNFNDTARSVSELLVKGVLKKRRDGAIFVPQLVDEEILRRKRAKGGQLGGNPNLKVNLHENLLPTLLLVLEHESGPSALRLEGVGEEGKPQGLTFPEKLQTECFQKVWNDWVQHRMRVGKSVNFPVMFQKQLLWLSEFPHDTACRMIDQSLRFGWQGIFELNNQSLNGRVNGSPVPRPLSINELRTVMQAKENKVIELKRKYCSEVATGDSWSDNKKRQEYFEIRKEIKTLNNQISAFA